MRPGAGADRPARRGVPEAGLHRPRGAFCNGKKQTTEHFTALWAAKEAVFRALGTTWKRGMNWTDVEVVCENGGPPRGRRHRADPRADGRPRRRIASCSRWPYCRAFATATAIALRPHAPAGRGHGAGRLGWSVVSGQCPVTTRAQDVTYAAHCARLNTRPLRHTPFSPMSLIRLRAALYAARMVIARPSIWSGVNGRPGFALRQAREFDRERQQLQELGHPALLHFVGRWFHGETSRRWDVRGDNVQRNATWDRLPACPHGQAGSLSYLFGS